MDEITKNRANLKTVVTFIPPDVSRSLKILAAGTERTVQSHAQEAILDYVVKHGPELDLIKSSHLNELAQLLDPGYRRPNLAGPTSET